MILGKDAADESYKLATVLDHVICYIDQTNLIIQFKHVLCAFVQISNGAFYGLDLVVYLIQDLLFCLCLFFLRLIEPLVTLLK